MKSEFEMLAMHSIKKKKQQILDRPNKTQMWAGFDLKKQIVLKGRKRKGGGTETKFLNS